MAPQITLLYLEFLYGFLCAPVVLSFWYRKSRIIVLSDKQNSLFIHCSLNVYPKLQLEHFNVYSIIGPCCGPDTHLRHYKCWFQAMSDSGNMILLFRSKTVKRGTAVYLFLLFIEIKKQRLELMENTKISLSTIFTYKINM